MFYNDNGEIKKLAVKAVDGLPIGTIIEFSSTNIPSGFLICDGSEISRKTYKKLFNVIGTTYGTGDGVSTFNLPNRNGKVPVGLDETQPEFNTLGRNGGEKTHKLTYAEMPSHKHSLTDDPANEWIMYWRPGVGNIVGTVGDKQNLGGLNDQYTSLNGGDQAHNNIQPYETTIFIIKADDYGSLPGAKVVSIPTESDKDTYDCNYINALPQILSGTESPDASLGKDGDIYIKYSIE